MGGSWSLAGRTAAAAALPATARCGHPLCCKQCPTWHPRGSNPSVCPPTARARCRAGQGAGHVRPGGQAGHRDHRPPVGVRPPAGRHPLQGPGPQPDQRLVDAADRAPGAQRAAGGCAVLRWGRRAQPRGAGGQRGLPWPAARPGQARCPCAPLARLVALPARPPCTPTPRPAPASASCSARPQRLRDAQVLRVSRGVCVPRLHDRQHRHLPVDALQGGRAAVLRQRLPRRHAQERPPGAGGGEAGRGRVGRGHCWEQGLGLGVGASAAGAGAGSQLAAAPPAAPAGAPTRPCRPPLPLPPPPERDHAHHQGRRPRRAH